MTLMLNKRIGRLISYSFIVCLLLSLSLLVSSKTGSNLAGAAAQVASDLKSTYIGGDQDEENSFVLTDIAFEKCTSFAFYESCTDNIDEVYKNIASSSDLPYTEVFDSIQINRIYKNLFLENSYFTTVYVYEFRVPLHTAKEYNIPILEDLFVYNENDIDPLLSEDMKKFQYRNQIPSEVLKCFDFDEKKAKGKEKVKFDMQDLASKNYYNPGFGLWYKKSTNFNRNKIYTNVNVLFGPMKIEQPYWVYPSTYPLHLKNNDKSSEGLIEDFKNFENFNYHQYDHQAYIILKKWNIEKNSPSYSFKTNSNNVFKIIQLADLHMSTGLGKCLDIFPEINYAETNCLADVLTNSFVGEVLDIEKPDLVVLTGDQIHGEYSPDSETSLLKALQPILKRKIPFAIVFGNHDDELGSLTRAELMEFIQLIPYNYATPGSDDIPGIGNYELTVNDRSNKPLASIFMLDSHSYASNKKERYDWFKPEQLDFVKMSYNEKPTPISLAFFHIPLIEYRQVANADKDKIKGAYREGVMSANQNSGMFEALKSVNTKFISVGHDHVNDFCLDQDGVGLCYGGGAGFGGYAGYGGYERRIRVIEIDNSAKDSVNINTWKRVHGDVENLLDYQYFTVSK